jgi:hypothetical protein
MGSLPPGVEAPALLAELQALWTAYDGQRAHGLAPATTDAVTTALHTWRTASRTQLPREHHLSAATLAFVCVLRALSTQPHPAADGIDGRALLLAGVLTEAALEPSLFSQTVLMDILAAIRAGWVTLPPIAGFGRYVEALRHRAAVLACFAAPATVLDDGRYATAVPNSALLVPTAPFVLELEAFFFDAAVQLDWYAAAQPTSVAADAVRAVTAAATATVHTHKVAFAAAQWFALYWETLVAPGERDAYRRARPNLPTDARSVLAAFRTHVLNGTATCTDAVLADATNPCSVLTLAQRVWGRRTVGLTPTEAPVVGPSLRIVCGRLLLVDTPGVTRGTPFELVTDLLQRQGVTLRSAAVVAAELSDARASECRQRTAVFALGK